MAPPEGAREDGEHPAAAWMEKLLTNHAPSRPLHEHRWFCEIVRVLRALAGPPRPQCEEVQKSTAQGNGFMPSMTNKAPRQLSPVLAV
jgi:hypothetical protein